MISRNHQALNCKECNKQFHIRCGGVSPKQFKSIQLQNWICNACLLLNLPFSGDVTLENSLDCGLQLNSVEADYGPFLDNKSMNECRNHTEDHNDEYLQDLVHKLTTNAKHLKIAHLNNRGLRKKVDELRILLKLCHFDVFGVSETHLNSEIIDGEIGIKDYNLIRRDRPGRQGGGCVKYYRKSLKAIHRTDLEDEQVEGMCMQVKPDSRDILVGTIYRPPNQNSEFFTAFPN